MQNEEVDRIFNVASESFRTKWEAQRNSGRSLLELKASREAALTKEKRYQRKRTFWFCIMLACIPLTIFVQWHFNLPTQKALLSVALVIFSVGPVAATYSTVNGRWLKQKNEIERCDGILDIFAKSLATLNPLGTGNNYHDVIDEGYVKDRALTLAIRVVDAQATFDALRKNPEAGRAAVIHAGGWMEKCESDLERFESNLRINFGQSLNRPPIFRDAEAYLAKARPKV